MGAMGKRAVARAPASAHVAKLSIDKLRTDGGTQIRAQLNDKAIARYGEIQVTAVDVADDMKLDVELPNRPVYVGETVPVTVTWLFRRDPSDPNLSVPMLASMLS